MSGHGEDNVALDTARRTVPYDKLVLFTTKPESSDWRELVANEELANVSVEKIPVRRDDFLGTLAKATKLIAENSDASIHLHVAGGPNLVTSALLLASFEQGTTAFYCHERGVSWLPVIKRATFTDRFSKSEAHVLRTLRPGQRPTHEEIAGTALHVSTVRAALYRLQKQHLVEADAKTAELTPNGAHFRQHLLSAGGAIVRGRVEASDGGFNASRH